MKRIHLFEFEDLSWFPNRIRICMTRLLVVMHKLLGTEEVLKELMIKTLKQVPRKNILDLCSGSAGPMPEVIKQIRAMEGFEDITLTLSDLYPNKELARIINEKNDPSLKYLPTSVDATKFHSEEDHCKTMICSLHHFKPEDASAVLKTAKTSGQPLLVFEISDNSFPKALWWTAIPINFLMAFFITPLVRPMSWQQLLFSYLIPIIPLCFAWDGAVSNARTYTLEDLDKLLLSAEGESYNWDKGIIKSKSKNLFLIGLPSNNQMA